MNQEIPTFRFALRHDLQDELQFLPTKGEPNATGYDVRSAQTDRKPIVIKPGSYFKIPLGFRSAPEDGWWYKLEPRSSTFAKKYVHALCGVIDTDFNLELVFAGQYCPDHNSLPLNIPLVINYGDAIGQIIPVKRQEMIVESVTNEFMDEFYKNRNSIRNGGFGSTGK